jgi:hypothetical protein
MRLIFAAFLSATIVTGAFAVMADEFDVSLATMNRGSLRQATELYAYLQGHSNILKDIGEQVPEFVETIRVIDSVFRQKHMDPMGRAYAIMASSDRGQAALDKLVESLATSNRTDEYSETEVLVAMAEARSRIDGLVESPYWETILWLRFLGNPANELRAGYTRGYTSRGEPKALGVHISMVLPESWLEQRDVRTFVLRNWTNQYGTGGMIMSLRVSETGGFSWTAADTRLAYESGKWTEFLFEDAKPLGAELVLIEKRAAIRMDQESSSPQTSPWMGRTYVIPYDDKIVSFDCMVEDRGEQKPDMIEKNYGLLMPVCDLVANSIIFPDDR